MPRTTIILSDPRPPGGVEWRKWRESVVADSQHAVLKGADIVFDVSAIDHPTSEILSMLCSIYAIAQTRSRYVWLMSANDHWTHAMKVSRIDRLLRYV